MNLLNHTGAQLVDHGGWADTGGELVLPGQRYGHFVEALHRFHPDLKLLFDRAEGLWGIFREQKVKAQADLEWTGDGWSSISWLRPVWFRVLKIAWFTKTEDNKLVTHYREPGEFVFRYLKSKAQEEFDLYTAAEVHSKQLSDHHRKRRADEAEASGKRIEEIAEDAFPHLNRTLVQVSGRKGVA